MITLFFFFFGYSITPFVSCDLAKNAKLPEEAIFSHILSDCLGDTDIRATKNFELVIFLVIENK